MDFASALTALSNAMTLAKALRGIQKDYDIAAVRVQMAEIYDALADARIALADAKSVIVEREQQIKELEGGPVPGDPCPYCGARAMRMTRQAMNGQWETWTCGECTQTKDVRHDLPGPGRSDAKPRLR
ncbi:hypothetical protein [Novosphingobium sp. Fuku2-ISO-50]|uniref:hypothetical protein n=1 Tax=Novosphingobium sp. Fuku2-ISO-50 TaxID=1739114 RepID=UPI00076D8FC0|nr:hypothetical protein [Novosphingobium sp. Fuku2-ISO-50]KUR75211.1 hypothetical protein AQZ50_16475 [Novosphingobium sp. Fuku2-ISO-50]